MKLRMVAAEFIPLVTLMSFVHLICMVEKL